MGVVWQVGPGARLTFPHPNGPDEYVAIEDGTLVMDVGPGTTEVACSMFLVAKVAELEMERKHGQA